MPRQTFILNAAAIKAEMAKRKKSQEDFALDCGINPSNLSGYLKGVPANLKTLLKIAKLLGYTDEGKHLLLTLDDDGKPYRPVATEQAPAAQLSDELAFTSNRLTIKAIGDPDVISRVTTEQLTAAWRSLYSCGGTATVDDIQGGSIVITMRADDTATIDLINSFLAWRLQYLGLYELRVSTLAKDYNIIELILANFRFVDARMDEQCQSRLLSEERVTLATATGLHVIHLSQTYIEPSGMPPPETPGSVRAAMAATKEETLAEFRTIAHTWSLHSTLFVRHIQQAEKYWTGTSQDFVPQESHFPENALVKEQPAVMMDDETFLGQPQYHPS